MRFLSDGHSKIWYPHVKTVKNNSTKNVSDKKPEKEKEVVVNNCPQARTVSYDHTDIGYRPQSLFSRFNI